MKRMSRACALTVTKLSRALNRSVAAGAANNVKVTMDVQVQRRNWPQRFTRSFLGYRRHLGIITALRAAWIVSQ